VRGQPDELVAQRAQAHLDSALPSVPDRKVLEEVDIEIGSQLGVQPPQDIAVEGSCNALGVVGCRLLDT